MIIIFILATAVHAYNRDWGPIIPPFNMAYMNPVSECQEGPYNACLEIPSKKICKEKLTKTINPWLPLPWWYFYCQWLVTVRPTTVATSTVHPYFRRVLDELNSYRKRRKANSA